MFGYLCINIFHSEVLHKIYTIWHFSVCHLRTSPTVQVTSFHFIYLTWGLRNEHEDMQRKMLGLIFLIQLSGWWLLNVSTTLCSQNSLFWQVDMRARNVRRHTVWQACSNMSCPDEKTFHWVFLLPIQVRFSTSRITFLHHSCSTDWL